MLIFSLGLLEKIPASFWGVVVGSFFTIIGVALTNGASNRRLAEQLQHEREQKTKDRDMALRKEVFLAAAEAISTGTNGIRGFGNIDTSYGALTRGFLEKSSAISGVYLIATTNTVTAVASFMGELDVLYLKLQIDRVELSREKDELVRLDHQISEFHKDLMGAIDLMIQPMTNGAYDKEKTKELYDNFLFQQKRILQANRDSENKRKSLYEKEFDFMQQCIQERSKFRGLAVPIVAGLRAELGLPFETESYRQVLEDVVIKETVAIEAWKIKTMAAVQKLREMKF